MGRYVRDLSLDLATPFIGDMGLTQPDEEAFKSGLRRIIEEFRNSEGVTPSIEASFPQAVFTWAGTEFGPAFAGDLFKWGLEDFQCSSEDGIQVFLWNNIVRRGGLSGERDRRPPPQLVVILRGILAKRAKSPVHRLMPTSAWDKKLYDRHQYDQFSNQNLVGANVDLVPRKDRERVLRMTMELVQTTISRRDFLNAWHSTLAVIDHPDLEDLNHWGKEEASLLGMPLDRIEPPGNWR